MFEFVVENGSEDLEINEDEYIIYCDQIIYIHLMKKLLKNLVKLNHSELTWKSENNIDVQKDSAEKLFKLT